MLHNRVRPASMSNCFFMILLVLALLIAFYCFIFNQKDTNTTSPVLVKSPKLTEKNLRNKSMTDFKDLEMYTARGFISVKELNEEFYQPSGYEIIEPTLPVPKLRMLKEPTCEDLFSEALKISEQPKLKQPPQQFPIAAADDYMMSGYSALIWGYIDNVQNASHPTEWHRIGEFMRFSKRNLAKIEYQAESESIYTAMSAYRLDGKNGFIIGSMKPWLEVMALQNGAQKILTVEHFPLEFPDAFKNRLSSIHPNEFTRNWKQYHESFDFAASFSNIQHYGLGRFGDPLDALGDLKEMLKTRCLLKKGGLLFLGVPIGIDAIVYNVQRIYGPIRMAMMFIGYEWIATFSHTSSRPITLKTKTFSSSTPFKYQHYTLVLKKI